LLMNLLERSFQTDVYHESDPRAFDNYEMRPAEIIDRLIENSRAPVFVIKALCELQDLSALMARYAPSKTVWIVRRFDDVVNSMTASFRNFHKQLQRIVLDRHADGWRSRGMSDDTHALLTQLVHPEITEADGSALQWYFRNVLFFEQSFDADPRVLLLRYEDLVSDPEATVKRMFEHLSLPFSQRITRDVFATSVGKRPASALDRPIREACEALAARFQSVL